MKSQALRVFLLLALVTMQACSTAIKSTNDTIVQERSDPQASPDDTATVPFPDPTSSAANPTSATPHLDPFDLISQDSLFRILTALTDIQAYSGWRNSASEGEAQALDYVAGTLDSFEYLKEMGLALNRQQFRVMLGTEIWETSLFLYHGDQETQVPANGLRGPRDDVPGALRFDSDGQLNDSDRNPITVSGTPVILRTARQVRATSYDDIAGQIVFLDYAAIDRVVNDHSEAVNVATELLSHEPAGVVLVTSFSNRIGESHGSFVGDRSALDWADTDTRVPVVYVRLEDLQMAGIQRWSDLSQLTSARLIWDTDVFSPAPSGNLVAHIPGQESSQAVILGAHIDSPNSPGAMDDGSGSAILVEIARVLNDARTIPPLDLYLVWFGSEELGLYGGSHFVATHQELLDRTQFMLQTDMLSRPLDGIEATISLVSWPYGRVGSNQAPLHDHLVQVAADHGVDPIEPITLYEIYSDNSTFTAFDVPNADLVYEDGPAMEATGSFHYAAHIHDPYDTVSLAREVGDVFEDMARVALAAALSPAPSGTELDYTPAPDKRAVFVASHTEVPQMSPSSMLEFGLALSMEGIDLDLIPYGQPVTKEDLSDADLVVALPVVDYPSLEGDVDLYDEAWLAEEVDTLEAYVAGGGFLIVTNSAHRIKYGSYVYEANEDWSDVNDLTSRFGIAFEEGHLPSPTAIVDGTHPLVDGTWELGLTPGNGLPFQISTGVPAQVLARTGNEPVLTLVSYGENGGEVLVLADVGMLGLRRGSPDNLPFWTNIGHFAGHR